MEGKAVTDRPQNITPSLELQKLTLSDPAARGNMLRHIAAVRHLFTGEVADAEHLGLMIATGFGVTDDAEALHLAHVAADGVARLYLMFDVDDALGPPFGYGLFHLEEGKATFYHYAAIWIPAHGGRPMIAASNGERRGFFAYRHGSMLRARTPRPSDFEPGYARAAGRIARLLQRPEIRDFAPDPVFTLFRN